MAGLKSIVQYILGFEAYVMLPLLILMIALVFRIRLQKAIQSSLTIGIGFIGIFMVFDFFVENLGPALTALIQRTGLEYDILDIGWPPLAAISWSYYLAPILIVTIILVNGILLFFKWTDTINIDLWNYWHFISIAAIVNEVTNSVTLALIAALGTTILMLKLGDWSAPVVKKFSGLSGISITTFSGLVYYPMGLVGDKLLSYIPGVKDMKADPEHIKKKLGLFGQPMIIGFIMGTVLGISAGYEVKQVLELAFKIGAVVYILPLMCEILGKGLMPISDGVKEYLQKRFPHVSEKYIGLDLAVLVGNPSVVVTGLLLMPVALILAFVLPEVRFIPLGDLPNMMGAIAMVVVATRGNVVRAFIVGIPIIIGKLYAGTFMAGIYTNLAQKAQFSIEGYDGVITSFLDGGNLYRFWIVKLVEGNIWAFIVIPAIIAMCYYVVKVKRLYKANKV